MRSDVVATITCNTPRWSARISPAAVGLEELDAALTQLVHQVDDVEVVDESVGELDEDPP